MTVNSVNSSSSATFTSPAAADANSPATSSSQKTDQVANQTLSLDVSSSAPATANPDSPKIDFSNCHQITEEGLARLAALPPYNPSQLSSQKTDQVANQTLSLDVSSSAPTTANPDSPKIDFSYCHQITEEGLARLAALPPYNRFQLITDAGLLSLGNINNMEESRPKK